MAVHIGELTSTVETEGSAPPAAAPAAAEAEEPARTLRDAIRRLRRDEARTDPQERDD